MYIRYNNTRNECNQVYRYLYKKKISLLKLRVVVYSILGGVGMYMAMYTLVDYIYKIFFSSGKFFVKDRIEQNEIKEINADEYTNILQAVHDDLDSYIGLKIKFSGYVYRILDFNEKQFVLGRDMLINTENNQSVVVGFLCENKEIKKFENDEWIEIVGEITKGKYHNSEIPIIKVTEIKKVDMPENIFVLPPNKTYIPTSGIL